MKFFLCWGSGSCNDGSCSGNNVETFSTVEEAKTKLVEVKERHSGVYAVIIKGELIWSEDAP